MVEVRVAETPKSTRGFAMNLRFESATKSGEAQVRIHERTIEVIHAGKRILFHFAPTKTGYRLKCKGKIYDTYVSHEKGSALDVWVNGQLSPIKCSDLRRFDATQDASATSSENEIRAIMPGRVSKLLVTPGDQVSNGDALLVLEAMKMENEIKTNVGGTVASVHVSMGDSVERGELLIALDLHKESGK
jgi:acetyl/propionyl-CoA carboxylase alpha subunit